MTRSQALILFRTDNCAWTLVFALVLVLAPINHAAAKPRPASTPPAESEVARCIHLAAEGKPWLEKTLWGLRDQESGWIGAEIRNTNGSHDLGPLQVNSWWVTKIATAMSRPAMHVRWWLTHDACFNVNAARWIFLSGLAVTRDFWNAVGVYHSPTEWRQQRYRASVARHLRQRFGVNVFQNEGVRSSQQ